MRLSGLHIYPVKSARGTSVTRWPVDAFGLARDRRFMLVDTKGRFITQREQPRMTQLGADLTDEGVRLTYPGHGTLTVEHPTHGEAGPVEIWGESVVGHDTGDEAARWLAAWLGQAARLVYMHEDTHRPVHPDYAGETARVSFADGFPFLLIGEASLEDLNARLPAPIEMVRFRPNLVVTGSTPFAEDTWRRIRIGDIELDVVKPCARCVIPTLDLTTGQAGKEPLRTLATYRKVGSEVLFGQNLTHRGPGTLSVGDAIEVLSLA